MHLVEAGPLVELEPVPVPHDVAREERDGEALPVAELDRNIGSMNAIAISFPNHAFTETMESN